MMICSRLLKSCATPPVSWPTASIFWAWRSASSAFARRCDLFGDAALQRLVQRCQRLLGASALGDLALRGAEQARVVDRDGGLGGDAYHQLFVALVEPPGLRMAEEQAAEHLARAAR